MITDDKSYFVCKTTFDIWLALNKRKQQVCLVIYNVHDATTKYPQNTITIVRNISKRLPMIGFWFWNKFQASFWRMFDVFIFYLPHPVSVSYKT